MQNSMVAKQCGRHAGDLDLTVLGRRGQLHHALGDARIEYGVDDGVFGSPWSTAEKPGSLLLPCEQLEGLDDARARRGKRGHGAALELVFHGTLSHGDLHVHVE